MGSIVNQGRGKKLVIFYVFSPYFVLLKPFDGKIYFFVRDYTTNSTPGLIGIQIMQIGLIFTKFYSLLLQL